MLDFRVYTFLAVCEYMNYTRAAEALHITQPAVSQHIRYLENMYQVKLFLAEGKKIHLSPAGERLLHAATTLKNDEVFLRKQMFEGAGKGLSLRFGTTRTIGESVISTPLARYIHSHPKDRISVVINNTDELLHKLVSGEIQFALVEGYYDDVDFDSMVFRTEPFIPVCAAGHVFAGEPVQLRDLLEEHLLIREPGSGTGISWRRIWISRISACLILPTLRKSEVCMSFSSCWKRMRESPSCTGPRWRRG